MRLWLVLTLLLALPGQIATGRIAPNVWQPANTVISPGDLTPMYLPLVKRANGEVRVKPISFNTF